MFFGRPDSPFTTIKAHLRKIDPAATNGVQSSRKRFAVSYWFEGGKERKRV